MKSRRVKIRRIAVISLVMILIGVIFSGCGQKAAPASQEKIGIIGAMAEEVDLLKKEIKNNHTSEVSGMEFYEGTLNGKDVVIVQCGMGKVNAARTAQILIDKFDIEYIINIGSAGAINDKLNIENLIYEIRGVQVMLDSDLARLYECANGKKQ